MSKGSGSAIIVKENTRKGNCLCQVDRAAVIKRETGERPVQPPLLSAALRFCIMPLEKGKAQNFAVSQETCRRREKRNFGGRFTGFYGARDTRRSLLCFPPPLKRLFFSFRSFADTPFETHGRVNARFTLKTARKRLVYSKRVITAF